jgi:NAD(P)-dependent dehydrogenase (short-subunit alcohol dehydrogenase family)
MPLKQLFCATTITFELTFVRPVELQLQNMTNNTNHPSVAVYGASGHTGRFVVAELRRRNLHVVAIVRHPNKSDLFNGVETYIATIDDPNALDRALARSNIVINCAGPFLDTAAALIESALRVRVHYLDITAEQQSAYETLANYDQEAREAGVMLIPALGFFGGLAELMTRLAMIGFNYADNVRIGVALDSWHPTEGTRATGKRNNIPRVVVANRQLTPVDVLATDFEWDFPEPFRRQQMTQVPLSEIVLIWRDRRIANAQSYMNALPLAELNNPLTPSPIGIDYRGRSLQQFAIEVLVQSGNKTCRVCASGQDIYAISAAIVVEATQHVLSRPHNVDGGAYTIGELFEAQEFLNALVEHYPGFEINHNI